MVLSDLYNIYEFWKSTSWKLQNHNFFCYKSYETTKTLKPIAEDDHMLIAAHVINVINVTDKYYSNAQIFWLLPFQLVYEQEDHEQQEDYIIR